MSDARFYPLDRAKRYLDTLPLKNMARLDLDDTERGVVVYFKDTPVGVLTVADGSHDSRKPED